jgi:hypothetical protein
MVDKGKRAAEGLYDLLDGLEYHYPEEVNEENVAKILSDLSERGMDLPVLAAGSTDGAEPGQASRRGPGLFRQRAAWRARGRML